MTAEEIKAKYKTLHDDFTEGYYRGSSGLTKETFDIQHGKIWADMEAEIKTASDYIVPEPVKDLAQRVSELEAKIAVLEKR